MIEPFSVKVELHQGSTHSHFIFDIIIDELSRSIWESILWCMLFDNDILLLEETSEELNTKLME